MDVARILVVQEENPGSSADLRLVASRTPVEFSFIGFDQVVRREVDISPYVAVVASLDCDHGILIDSLRQGPDEGPPLFLFRSAPPLQDIARWVTWADSEEGAEPVTAQLLSESMEYYSLASLYQRCLKIVTCDEEGKLLTRVADTFVQELGLESCVIWLASPLDSDEMMIASVRGLISIDREGSRFHLSQTEWAEPTARGKPFLHPVREDDEAETLRDAGRSSLYVPLMFREKPVGLVKLAAKADRKPYRDRDLYIAGIIADHAAAAWRKLTSLVRMERMSLRDGETKVHSMAFLSDYFEKERYKSGRFRRPLSIVFLIVDNLSRLKEQTRETLVSVALSDMVDAVYKVLRDSDLIARAGSNRFCVLLPETDHFGSVLALRRLRKAVRGCRSIEYRGTEYRLESYFVSTTFPRDGKSLKALWEKAEEKYREHKRSPIHLLHLPEKVLWDAFDVLVGKREYYDRLREGRSVPYFSRFKRDRGRNGHFCLKRENFLRMVESVAQDTVSQNMRRGLVIAAGPRPEIFKQIFLSLAPDADNGRNVYIIGREGSTRFDSGNLLYVNAGDDRLRERELILFLKENGAYGLFAVDREDEVCGFNTADEWVVDAMMEKVQETYRLQGNF